MPPKKKANWPRYVVQHNNEPIAEPFNTLEKAQAFAKLVASKLPNRELLVWVIDDVTGDVVGLHSRDVSSK